MAGNQTIGKEDVKQIGLITYLPAYQDTTITSLAPAILLPVVSLFVIQQHKYTKIHTTGSIETGSSHHMCNLTANTVQKTYSSIRLSPNMSTHKVSVAHCAKHSHLSLEARYIHNVPFWESDC